MKEIAHVRQVQACDDYVLHITFNNGVTKLYDLKPKLNDERFSILRDRGFFKPCRLTAGDSELVGTMMST
ncbi:DUF2442 domain-containing protein [Sporomusa acidovorans]|uniref:DUF2442 domain-containing protein n=1 Tax=Sporomusa acidovorans TaxID=112900 RepID=UPI001B8055B8|nr:DUF2442 domain-containing protein [Sporomusa acidovorans]